MGRNISRWFVVGDQENLVLGSEVGRQAWQPQRGLQDGCGCSVNCHRRECCKARGATEWRAQRELNVWSIRGWFLDQRAGIRVATGALLLCVWFAAVLAPPSAMAMATVVPAIAGKSVMEGTNVETGAVQLIKHGRSDGKSGKESRGRGSRDGKSSRGNRSDKESKSKGSSSGKKDSARGKQRSGKKSGHKSGKKSKASHARTHKSSKQKSSKQKSGKHKQRNHKFAKHKSNKHKSDKHKSAKHKSRKHHSKRAARVIKGKRKVHKVVRVKRVVRTAKIKKSIHKRKKKTLKIVKVKKTTKVMKTRKVVGKRKKIVRKIVKVKKVTKVRKTRKVVGKRKKIIRKVVKVKRVKRVFKTIRLKRKGRHKKWTQELADHTVTHSTPVAASDNGAGSAATPDENLRCVKVSQTGGIRRAVHPRIRNGRGSCPGGYQQLRLFNRGWHATLPESYGDEEFVLQFANGEVQLLRIE